MPFPSHCLSALSCFTPHLLLLSPHSHLFWPLSPQVSITTLRPDNNDDHSRNICLSNKAVSKKRCIKKKKDRKFNFLLACSLGPPSLHGHHIRPSWCTHLLEGLGLFLVVIISITPNWFLLLHDGVVIKFYPPRLDPNVRAFCFFPNIAWW